MDQTIIISIIGGFILIISNLLTAILTYRFTSKRDKSKWEFDLVKYVIDNPEKLPQIEKKIALGILMVEPPEIRYRKFVIPHNRILIGRKSTCDIVLVNSKISNEHCAVSSDGEKIYIEDLISTNGTYLNNELIKSKCELNDKDEIRIQDTIIKYKKLDKLL